ncbi:hypothetical protein [Nannocystis pusilla]|uniref:Outer membrane protein beta-barrel domain-containing protein n=1 Tax=Nannocystis pusilla TaxID=889268 RepID=A0ABS7TQD9_9BACT|nr:hypothetical protein [Nannocystis pusilla]MBZ5710439.1 hypothetical protein [Nannocystis pusilla]
MSSLTLALVLSFAPAPADRSGAAEAPTAVEAWSPAPAESAAPAPAPAPAPAAAAPTPMPLPMPVPAPAPEQPPVAAAGPPPPPPASAPIPPPSRKRTWPDRPIRWRLDIAGEIGTSVIRDPAWRAFDDNRSAFNAGGGVRGDFRLGKGRVFLGGGATFRRFGSYGGIYDAIDMDITVRDVLAFLRLSIVAVEGVDVFVQAGGGPSFASLSTHTYGSYDAYDAYYGGSSAYQRNVLGMGDGQAGLALYLPKKWLPRRGASRATAGLEFAAGYTFRSKLAVRPALNVDEDPIPTHTSEFGDVAVRGFQWRFGLFVRFQ